MCPLQEKLSIPCTHVIVVFIWILLLLLLYGCQLHIFIDFRSAHSLVGAMVTKNLFSCECIRIPYNMKNLRLALSFSSIVANNWQLQCMASKRLFTFTLSSRLQKRRYFICSFFCTSMFLEPI